MSAFGTKRTCRVALHMSAFGGKADIAHVIDERQLCFSQSPETRCCQFRMASSDPAAAQDQM